METLVLSSHIPLWRPSGSSLKTSAEVFKEDGGVRISHISVGWLGSAEWFSPRFFTYLAPVLAYLEQLRAGQASLAFRQPPHLASSQQSNFTAVELHT